MRNALSLVVALSLSLAAAGCSKSGSKPSTTTTSIPAGQTTGVSPKISLGPVVLKGPAPKPLVHVALPTGTSSLRSTSKSLTVGGSAASAALSTACSTVTLGMNVLVISGDGSDPELGAVRSALDYHSIPYTVWIANQKVGLLTASELATGPCAGKYQGVILTTDGGDASILTPAEGTALRAYEAGYGVRELTWFAWPTLARGLGAPASGTPPISLPTTLTTAGQAAFPYVAPAATITITNNGQSAWPYQAPATGGATPLLVDASANALVSTFVTSDAREIMTVTYGSNQSLLHDLVLAHGFVEWVTRGVYLGQYRAYLTPQEDDIFIPDDIFPATNDLCSTGAPCTCGYISGAIAPSGGCFCGVAEVVGGPVTAACTIYRMSADDMTKFAAWQDGVQARPGNAGFRLAHAFVGGADVPAPDPALEAAAKAVEAKFLWINHTFTHMNLDNPNDPLAGGPTTGKQVSNVWIPNEAFATRLGFTSYRSDQIVTPDVSGLTNKLAMQALAHLGVRYMVTDASRPGCDNPQPNVGMWSQFLNATTPPTPAACTWSQTPQASNYPNMYLVPRRATNLFYDVVTPAEWVAQYNAFFCKAGVNGQCTITTWFTTPQTIAQILDTESNNQLTYVLRGDLSPQMYHQSNLGQYAPGKTLLGDLMDATIAKYRAYSALPIQSVDLHAIGEQMKATGYRNAALAATPGLTATLTLTPGATTPAVTAVTLLNPTAKKTPVVVSGMCAATPAATRTETYANKCITTVSVPTGGTVALAP